MLFKYIIPPTADNKPKVHYKTLPISKRHLSVIDKYYDKLTFEEQQYFWQHQERQVEKQAKFKDFNSFFDYRPTEYNLTDLRNFKVTPPPKYKNWTPPSTNGLIPTWSLSHTKFLQANIMGFELLDLLVYNKYEQKQCWITGKLHSVDYSVTKDFKNQEIIRKMESKEHNETIYGQSMLFELCTEDMYWFRWKDVQSIAILNRLSENHKILHYKSRVSAHKDWKYAPISLPSLERGQTKLIKNTQKLFM